MEKHPVRTVREATGLSQKQFGELVSYAEKKFPPLENWKAKLTIPLRKRIAIATGAWIAFDDGDQNNPLPPVFLDMGIGSVAIDFDPFPFTTNFYSPKEYTSEHWELWKGGWRDGDPILRHWGASEGFSFWLELLITAGVRRNRGLAVRAELVAAFEEIRKRYGLEDAMDGILSQYEPLFPEVEIPDFESFSSRLQDKVKKATWEPGAFPPPWLLTATQLEPLILHAKPPTATEGNWSRKLRERFEKSRETFVGWLRRDPKVAARKIKEDRNERECQRLVMLAEHVEAFKKRRDLSKK